ncbi:MAG: hypothetical protein J2P17_09095, partial [Mycobacterium sp.]|nr:hypothetical protein [Mycobacterium sp.]
MSEGGHESVPAAENATAAAANHQHQREGGQESVPAAENATAAAANHQHQREGGQESVPAAENATASGNRESAPPAPSDPGNQENEAGQQKSLTGSGSHAGNNEPANGDDRIWTVPNILSFA